MARYSRQHKEATRRRMIEAAGRRFKADGIDGSGISTLVADAGLTNGAFYGHFDSKDDLVAHVVAQQLADQEAIVAAMPIGPASLDTFLRQYLSPSHCEDKAGGCASAALLDEIGRCDEPTRQAYSDGVRALVAAISRHLGDGDDAGQRAISLFALLVGSLQLARAVTDPAMSEQILAAALTSALRIAGSEPGRASAHPQEAR